MKKFSNISNYKVNSEEPTEDRSVQDDKTSIKYAVSRLIEEFLKIRIYGPIDPILEGTIKIEGKEEFIDSLIDLFKNDEVSKTLKLLQEAKFNGVDNMINVFEHKVNESYTKSESIKHQKTIKDILEKSEGDKDKAIEIVNKMCERIKDGEKCFYRSIAAENLIGEDKKNDSILREISKLFLHKSKNLGYRK